MTFLLINTCGGEGVAALAGDAGVLAEEALPGRGTSEALMPAVRKLFERMSMKLTDLAGIGVVVGPGSFTGVRVGLAAAKGLCDGAALKMIAMSRLELVAADDGVAVLDGGRGEYYCGVYRAGQRISEALLTDAQTRALGPTVTCEERVAERLGVDLIAEPGAEVMLAMVLKRAAVGDWTDIETIDANYLRRTDAELLQAGKA